MKKTVLLIVLFFAANIIAFAVDKPIKTLLAEGQSALEKADYQSAIISFQSVIDKDSNNIQARYQRGVAFFYSSRYDMAKPDFEFVVKKNPKFPDGWNFLGLTKSYLGDLQGSMENFAKAIQLDPKFAEALLNRASGYLVQKELDKALKDADAAAKLSPKNPEIFLVRGNIYKEKENFVNAAQDYEKTAELGIRNVDIYYRLGNSYYMLKKLNEAVKAYSDGLSLDAENVDLLNNRAVSLSELGRILEAERDRTTIKQLTDIKLTPIDQIKFVQRTDKPKMFSLNLPENWAFKEEDGIISISNLTDVQSSRYTVNGTISIALNIGDTLKFDDPQQLMSWWDEKLTKSGDNYFHYYFRSKKDKPYRGQFPQKFTKAQVQYTDNGEIYYSYDMAIAYGKHLFHINFQFPEKEFDYYDPLIDKILSSVALTF